MHKRLFHITFLILLTNMLSGCVESFDAATEDFESVLVIDALITNEVKHQEINLSRTFRFEEEKAGSESNALVKVVDDMQNEFIFEENNPGQYVSVSMFAAQPNVNYQLSITTSEGSIYESTPEVLPKNTPIDDLYASMETNDQNVEGVAILVDTYDPEGESQYYRFDYEETYKIVAPFWNPLELIIENEERLFIRPVPRAQEEQVCYNTVNSVNIILGDTSGFSEDRLNRFEVRFLARDNYIIGHRYSILVRQYVISREAHIYYETLNEFSGLESIFSENQPGFFNGNISPKNDSKEKVVGFFDVSSVDEKRIFFDHKDFFPEDLVPAFPFDCPITTPTGIEFINGVRFETTEYWANHSPEDASEGFFKVVPRICGDCTVLGSNIVPDFWIE
ncbi:DUF4249 domain-containing protein [Flagellimonas hymeniacidonis]|uniref:DUF4249 domain-containing protein n=1 Tax=Flagellimonas hymeniacidonis TaxID=2603628 RepID=A0A5C8V1U1_9FLAO|nr:DUF4249 domain-containing protein [Flagellimonas hymeniacidonis]TXN35550.1 DUF4249 domain-containing protein [Flagellimonas hymeniacidonis]